MRIALALITLIAVVLDARPSRAASVQSAVADVLARSAQAWNAGNLDAFMTSYENSAQTVYISSTAVVHGFAAIRARYGGHYKPGQMGVLSVSDLAVRGLGADYAVANARWHVHRLPSAGGNVSGLFSLVLHRSSAGWHIITDHTP